MDKILIGREYIKELMIRIEEERENIDMCIYEMFHKYGSKYQNVNYMIERLWEKADKGVLVRVLMNSTLANPKNKQNMQIFKQECESKGGQVVEIKKGILMHAKAVQFGKRYILIGSHNVSDRSYKSHFEISVGTESLEINKNFREWFDTFFK